MEIELPFQKAYFVFCTMNFENFGLACYNIKNCMFFSICDSQENFIAKRRNFPITRPQTGTKIENRKFLSFAISSQSWQRTCGRADTILKNSVFGTLWLTRTSQRKMMYVAFVGILIIYPMSIKSLLCDVRSSSYGPKTGKIKLLRNQYFPSLKAWK